MFEKNIKYLRLKKNWRQVDLSDRLGYKSLVTVNKWESGVSTPPYSTLANIARLFDVSEHDLMYVDLEKRDLDELTSDPKGDTIRINVYSRIHAGFPSEITEDIVDWEDIPKEMTTGGREYFGLKVCGDCMSPKYLEGDTIIVRKQPDCESGQDCVVYVDNEDAELRRVIKLGDEIILQPLNPTYTSQVYNKATPSLTICGVVVEIRRKV